MRAGYPGHVTDSGSLRPCTRGPPWSGSPDIVPVGTKALEEAPGQAGTYVLRDTPRVGSCAGPDQGGARPDPDGMHIPSCLRHGPASRSRHHRAGCYVIPTTTHYMSAAGTSRPSTSLSSDRDRGWMTSESTPPIIFQRPGWRTKGWVHLREY
jgi:hypothetical protein